MKRTRKSSRVTLITAANVRALPIGSIVQHANGLATVIESYGAYAFVQLANGATFTASVDELTITSRTIIRTPKPTARPMQQRATNVARVIVQHIWVAAKRRGSNIRAHRRTVASLAGCNVCGIVFA